MHCISESACQYLNIPTNSLAITKLSCSASHFKQDQYPQYPHSRLFHVLECVKPPFRQLLQCHHPCLFMQTLCSCTKDIHDKYCLSALPFQAVRSFCTCSHPAFVPRHFPHHIFQVKQLIIEPHQQIARSRLLALEWFCCATWKHEHQASHITN